MKLSVAANNSKRHSDDSGHQGSCRRSEALQPRQIVRPVCVEPENRAVVIELGTTVGKRTGRIKRNDITAVPEHVHLIEVSLYEHGAQRRRANGSEDPYRPEDTQLHQQNRPRQALPNLLDDLWERPDKIDK